MTDKDKLAKVRAEIKRLYNQSLADENRQADRGLEGAAKVSYGKSIVCKELLSFIDSLQEEPTSSIWHDANKEQPEIGSAVAVWNSKIMDGEIFSRCVEVYQDRIWAYIDDLLKL